MTADEELELLHAMEKFGGGFARRLAQAWLVADSDNKRLLRAAFLPLLRTYRQFTEPAP